MKKSTIFVLSTLVFDNIGMMQTKTPLGDLYTPLETSNFGRNSKTAKPSDKTDDEWCANALRLSILDFARSQVRLVYERKLGDSFAVTSGFGLSFGSDYVENIFMG